MIAGLRATARALGISHVTLLSHVREGKAPRLSDGRFDVEQVRAALAQNLDGRQKSKVIPPDTPVAPRPAPTVISPPIEASGAERARFHAEQVGQMLRTPSRADKLVEVQIRERTMRLARDGLRLQKEAGALVAVEEIEAATAAMVTNCRARLLAIPARLADRVAVETSPTLCQDMILSEIERGLGELIHV